ncbi:MAG: Gldg family protein [Deltaproteobacteria bacterium]|nr:Gldg family protein [Deltaproteobacteria bacterium]
MKSSSSRRAPPWIVGTLALAWRELLSLFVTPLAYVVGTLFLLLQGSNFALLLRVLNEPLAAPGPVMQYYFGGSFFIFWLPVLFMCSTISMRLLAEERKQGTLEALLTAPLSPSQVVLGKFTGAMGFYAALWLPTVIFYVLLRGAQVQPDPGPILAGYMGTGLCGASFVALGLVTSALTRSQLSAAIGSFVVCTIVLLAGLLTDQVGSATLAKVLAATSLLTMMQELAQGIVDGRWLWLHGAVVAVSLATAVVVVDPRRRPQQLVQLVLFGVAVGHLAWLGARHSTRDDWTGGRVYSLSPRAEAVLSELSGPVDVRVLVPSTIGSGRPNPLAQELREVLSRMATHAPGLRLYFLDPDRDREEAEQLVAEFGLGGRDLADGVVLVRAGQGTELRKTHLVPADLVTYATGAQVQATGPRVDEFRGEEALLSAFVQVTDPVELTVCNTQGHGEPRFDDLEPFGGYAHLGDLLRRANLKVQTADLDTPEGLSGCDVLLVAGVTNVFPAAQVRVIERYAERGGALLLLTGAAVRPSADGLARHGLEALAADYGIGFGDRVVLDPHEMAKGAPLLAYTIDQGWGDHPAVRALVGRPISLMFVRELDLVPAPEAQPPEVLVQVGEQAWAESDIGALRGGGVVEPDPGPDRMGPIPVAVAGQRGGSRMVVVASHRFALNAYLRGDIVYDHGRDLVLNAVGWLTDRDVLLGIRPRARENVKLVLLPEQLSRMTTVCLLGLPGFGIFLGIWVLWRRRR